MEHAFNLYIFLDQSSYDAVQLMDQDIYCDMMDALDEQNREELADAISIPDLAPTTSLAPRSYHEKSESESLRELEDWMNGTVLACSVLPTLHDEGEKAEESKRDKMSEKSDVLPSNEQDIVRYLINKQKFDGLWDLDSEIINLLTGKPLTVFESMNVDISTQILSSSIVILMLETRFSAFSSLWYGVVQKGRDRINDLLGKDSNKTDQLFSNLRTGL